MVPMIFWGPLNGPGAVDHSWLNVPDVSTTALIPMGAWCELVQANRHSN